MIIWRKQFRLIKYNRETKLKSTHKKDIDNYFSSYDIVLIYLKIYKFFAMKILQSFKTVILPQLKRRVQNFNLFPSIPPTTDIYELRTQIISTRSFIVMLIMSLYILLIYMLAFRITAIAIEPTPTLDRYEFLYARYSETLTCPCKKTSIDYEQMLHIQYELHQVCSSDLVSERWLQFLLGVRALYGYGYTVSFLTRRLDFRVSAPLIFQGLSYLCRMADEAINYSIQQTYITQYTSLALLSPVELQIQVQIVLGNLKSSTTSKLLLSIQTIREVIQVNSIATSVESNAFYQTDWFRRSFEFLSYEDCSCIRSAQCSRRATIYNSSELVYTAPDLFVGCFVLEALLKSSLACFYNQTCVDETMNYIRFNDTFDMLAMNSSNTSQFSTDITVQELFSELMVEKWSWKPLFRDYFDACQPVECKYTYRSKSSIVYIITTLFGVIGGLSTILQIIVPRLVGLIRRRKQQEIVSMTGRTGNIFNPLDMV